MPPGRLPRHREVILLWDLIDSAKPGEEIVSGFILSIGILLLSILVSRKLQVSIATTSMLL